MELSTILLVAVMPLLVMFILIVILAIRSSLIIKHRERALATAGRLMIAAIDKGEDGGIYKRFTTADSYLKMVWSVKKWRYKSFFPDLEDK